MLSEKGITSFNRDISKIFISGDLKVLGADFLELPGCWRLTQIKYGV